MANYTEVDKLPEYSLRPPYELDEGQTRLKSPGSSVSFGASVHSQGQGQGQKDLKLEYQSSSTASGSIYVKNQEGDYNAEKAEGTERASWGGQLEFILTCVGYAVGLGNVWRFPYLCYKNGGGAFLVPYVIMLSLVGLPLFFMELAFGQFASLGPISIWTVNPLLKGLGYTMVIVNTLLAIYYNVIIAWCMYYFFASMTKSLPWERCDNAWNTPACTVSHNATGLWNVTNTTTSLLNVSYSRTKTPSEEYFYNEVLQLSDGIEDLGEIRWPLAACLAAAWVIVFLVLIKGISSLGKVVYFSSIFPYVLLTAMLVRGVTLPGAMLGIKYYLSPDFSKLTDAQVWSDAAVQIFFSLSTCTGGLIAMASYNKFSNNCLRDAILVPLINCSTSIFAGFVIFSVLGFMALQKGVEVKDVAASGPGLVFVVYPEGLSQMPLAPLWAVLFFFMMLTLGFSSEFSIVECFFASFTDELSAVLARGKNRSYIFRAFFSIVFFVFGLPMVCKGGFYVFNLFDSYVGGFPLLIVGLLECFAIQYVYGFTRFSEDIYMMLGKKPNIYFKVTWCFLSPAILMGITIFLAVQYDSLSLFGTYVYPSWSEAIGWSLVGFPCACIPTYALYKLYQHGLLKLIVRLSKPSREWGPADPEDRTGRYQNLIYRPTDKSVVTVPQISVMSESNSKECDAQETYVNLAMDYASL